MSEFAPPPTPPPPHVPEGWKAVWNTQYNEYFYVNIYTKRSQWDKPTQPVYPSSEEHAPPAGAPPPPSYLAGGAPHVVGPEKGAGYGSNNPYPGGAGGSYMTDDERYARQLQAEEEARARSHGSVPYQQQGIPPSSSSAAPYAPHADDHASKSKGGLFGKLEKFATKVAHQQAQSHHGQPQHGYGAPYGHQAPMYGQPMFGGGHQPMFGGHAPMYGAPHRKPGMGVGGAAALGAGGGLLGGMMLANAMDDNEGGYGGGSGSGSGSDGGGDDMGGGDDFGGGDFGE